MIRNANENLFRPFHSIRTILSEPRLLLEPTGFCIPSRLRLTPSAPAYAPSNRLASSVDISVILDKPAVKRLAFDVNLYNQKSYVVTGTLSTVVASGHN